MYCMDFFETIRLHNETVRMMRDTQIQMLRTIERMNERMYHALEQQPIQSNQHTQPTQRRTRSVPQPHTFRDTRDTGRVNRSQPRNQNVPRREESYIFNLDIPTTSMSNAFTSLFRNGAQSSNIQYYILPFNRPMENVPIPVSDEVIARTCRVYSYQEDTSGNTECPIDLTPFNEGDEVMEISHCGHRFRSSNLRRWFQTNPRCPLCRIDVRDTSGNEPPREELPVDGIQPTQPNPHEDTTEVASIGNNVVDSSGARQSSGNLDSLLTSTLEELFTASLREIRDMREN